MNVAGPMIALLCGLFPWNDVDFQRPSLNEGLQVAPLVTSEFLRAEPQKRLRFQFVGEGFLFINNVYQPKSSRLEFTGDTCRLANNTITLLAHHDMTSSPLGEAETLSDANLSMLAEPSVFELNDRQRGTLQHALKSGGFVFLNDDQPPSVYSLTDGGDLILEALNKPPGKNRNALLTGAWNETSSPPAWTANWLKTVKPVGEFSRTIQSSLQRLESIENDNLASVHATQRFDNWTYPITIVAMMIFVFSMGTLLSAKPQELVAVAHSTSEMTVSRFLWLIAGMSIIDLVWTLLAYQANAISEVNPIGGVLLNNANRTAVFKLLATGLAIGILYRARQHQVARKATWWVCLTLSLLMARWILVSGVST